jgi:hypothetical protein
MKNKFFAGLLTVLGFVLAIGLPVYAASTQIVFLRSQCAESMLERVGVTASGAVVIGFIVMLVFWKYFAPIIRKKLGASRTTLGFFLVGYGLIFVIKTFIGALESIFLFGAIGGGLSVVCFYFSDILRGVK